jgi:S-adenosylmethionine:tRNA ribosyltransferase-isomerase
MPPSENTIPGWDPAAGCAYTLPAERIAQAPPAERDAARLLLVDGDRLADHDFTDLPDLLRPGDLLVANDTRVRAARLRGTRPGGGAAEVLVLGRDGDHRYACLVRPARKLPSGTIVDLGGGFRARIQGDAPGHPGARVVSFEGADDPDGAIERAGSIPLPPYIRRELSEPERYQTVYAAGPPASAAAPTAGLHFTERVLGDLEARGVGWTALRLEVGLGTFAPMTAGVEDHVMHEESFEIPAAAAERLAAARGSGARIVAVGTTTVRALESAAGADGAVAAGPGVTRLFIRPGHRFRVVDGMVTNFHQPRSSLLVLVAALVGPAWKRAYAHALLSGYRFLSFGDCMLAWGSPQGGEGER